MKHLTAAIFFFIATSALGQLYSTGLVFNDANYQKAKIHMAPLWLYHEQT